MLLVVVERGRLGGGGRVQGRFRVQDLDVVGNALWRPRLGGGVVEGLRRRMVDGVGRWMVMVTWLGDHSIYEVRQRKRTLEYLEVA